MNETIWVALIAVLGTAFGASIAPVVALVRESIAAKTATQSERIRAAAEFGTAIMKYAQMAPDKWESYQVREARNAAVEARFALARVIPRGEGNVDRFAETTIDEVAEYPTALARDVAAAHGARLILAWSRGDRTATSLRKFWLEQTSPTQYVVADQDRE